MKIFSLAFYSIALCLLFTRCKKDNYDPPTSILSGKVVYQGQPVGVRSGGVQLELWQPGYQLFIKIPVNVAWDGSYSAALFDGNYKLTRLSGSGPWVNNSDTINVTVNGATTVDVPVDPYFVMKSETFAKNGNNVNATVSIQRVNTTRALEFVRLYIGQTIITDQNNNAGNSTKMAADIPDANQPISLSAAIPGSLSGKDYVYARVGVKTVGVAELVYGVPQKIALK